MNWQPTTNTRIRIRRARLLKDIRAFFYEHGVLEVETPALSLAANTDPYIESFAVECASGSNVNPDKTHTGTRYLHTSPEYPMKRLLAAGSGDIYQIAKVWRKGESGQRHNPEFTLLEWYRVGFSYQRLIEEVNELLTSLFTHIQLPSITITYKQLFIEYLGIDPHTIEEHTLRECVHSNIASLETDNLHRQDLLDALLVNCIENQLPSDRLTFVMDYPTSQSALAAIKPGDAENPPVAERFEVYLGPMELGNGYQEETSHVKNKNILNRENTYRQHLNFTQMPQDSNFLAACKHGIPRCAGVALGIDRILLSLINDADQTNSTISYGIQNTINFPWDIA